MRFETYDHMKKHPIATAFASGERALAERFDFANPYGSERVWKERADAVDATAASSFVRRDAAADAVLAYNRRTNPVPEAIYSAERLMRSDALVVVGGQQAGLFTGPMLVVYKAITILRTARLAEAALGRPVVPLFWIAGEDHDWDEANHTYVLSPQLELKKPLIPHPEPSRRTSVSRTMLSPEAWAGALETLSDALPETEFKPELMNRLGEIVSSAPTLSEAFARTMSLLFGRHGLVLIDADDSALRAAEAPAFQQLIRRSRELSDALQAGERAVAAGGYPLQAESSEDGYNLFVFHEGERKLLFRDGGDAVDRKGTFRMSAEALERLAAEEPAAFSNNALTRPLMQEQLFPVLATVLGPSEIAYWSTLKEAFGLFGLRTPVIVPRQEFTLLEGTVQKQMDKFGLSFADAWEKLDERREAWLAAQDEFGLSQRFAAVKQQFVDSYRPLVDSAASINPGLRKLGDTNMGKIVEQIDFLESRTLDALKQQHEAGLRQWERIRWTVAPAGKPQERVYNVFQYVNRYGFDWVGELLEKIELDFAAPARPHEAIYL